jgi:hypothetical protein
MNRDSDFWAAEFDPKPRVPQPLLKGPLAALLEWQAMAEGAYSPNTLRAQKGGRRDLPSVLRIPKGIVFARRSEDDPGIYR